MGYEEEFGKEFKPEQAILDLLTVKDVWDQSWHNDVCPHLEIALSDDSHTLELWFDHPEQEQREFGPEATRYVVCERKRSPLEENPETMDDFETDDASAAAKRFMEVLTKFNSAKK